MKAVEIATRSHVSIDDLISVCKDLGISCEGEDSDLSEKDIFLVEKKIENIKEQKAKETIELMEKKNAKESKKGKKIKLKRKVQVSKGIKKKKPTTTKTTTAATTPTTPTTDKKKEVTKKKAVPTPEKAKKIVKRKEPEKKTRKPGVKDAVKRKTGPPAKGKKEEVFESKDSPKKRKKGIDRDKDKEKKRSFKREREEKSIHYRKKKIQQKAPVEVKREAVPPKDIDITDNLTVSELAKKLNIKANEIIKKLMKLGVMATINQIIDSETAVILAGEYGTEVHVVSLYDETQIKDIKDDKPEDRVDRPPIVTVMGHVDHGKTKLLDAIRETNVTDMEHGGITQHIGAYSVTIDEKKITFLDTPGHEAFTTMRARGAEITDIVVLVVAANDGVMPQTVEAINHAKDANVPIIVAINKIDLQDANTQKVRQELSNYELMPEEWGGSTLFAEISAKQKINIQGLLELVLIQAEMLELKANPVVPGQGTVIETRLDPGRGAVATVLVQNGILKVGDPYVVGVYSGRVRAMFNDRGSVIEEGSSSQPVEVIGLTGVPSAGDPFQVVENDKYAKLIAQKRQELKRIETATKVRKVTLEDLNEMIKEGEVQELRIIIKGDVDGSVQALKESLEKLSTDEIRVKVVHSGTGGINESDVMLASASNALILGYHVRPTVKVSEVADKEKVSIKFYNVIYDATNDIRSAMEGMLAPELREEIVGGGEVRQVFKVSKVGSIAGSIVTTGKVQRNNKIRLIRDGVVVFDGAISSLRRFKDEASEVESGQECGFSLENYNDVKEGDNFETYQILEIVRKLED